MDRVNRRWQKQVWFANINSHLGGDQRDKTFADWRMAFKPRTDDIREPPALALIDLLLESGA